MRNTILIAIALLFGTGMVVADSGVGFTGTGKIDNPLKPKPEGIKSLLASGRLDMQQSVGMSFGTGANRFSQYYLNTLTYKVSEPLTIQATLGIHNQSLVGTGYGASTGARVVIPNVGVLYKPTENMRISFSFSNAPYYGSTYDPFWGRRGY